MPINVPGRAGRTLCVLVFAGCLLRVSAAADGGKPSELVGTWRGTSTCVDHVAAPACRDEVVIYDFTPGAKPGTVHWKADKVVEGQRRTMGEMDLAYDGGEKCWAVEFNTARVHIRWRLVVEGGHLTGTGQLLPGKETVRRIDLRKD